jgi:hypothetical protein
MKFGVKRVKGLVSNSLMVTLGSYGFEFSFSDSVATFEV